MDRLHAALDVLKERGILGKILSSRVYEDRVVLVLDQGVSGCPKYEVSVSEIDSYISRSAAVVAVVAEPIQEEVIEQDEPTAVAEPAVVKYSAGYKRGKKR